MMLQWCYFICCFMAFTSVMTLNFTHHGNHEITSFLLSVNSSFPDITYMYSIGKSVRGQELWVLAIGSNVHGNVSLRPHVKYVGNMHGNEVVSREILLHLIDHLVTEYAKNRTIQEYLNKTVVHILPSLNPDGYDLSLEGDCDSIIGRYNHHYIDLNRNFPDPIHNRNQKPIQPETQAVIDWLKRYSFVLSANLHGGAMVANYPFDQYLDSALRNKAGPSLSPDDDMFKFLALTYARSHSTMAIDEGLECGDLFKDGITNGADWYTAPGSHHTAKGLECRDLFKDGITPGGMQDYNYIEAGVFETTLEVSCCKYPNETYLQHFWLDNKDALLNYIMEVHRGIKGIVKDENGKPVQDVKLAIQGRQLVPFKSLKNGEYFRLLFPGEYTLEIIADGYQREVQNFSVVEGRVTRLDLQLVRLSTSTSVTSDPTGSSNSIFWHFSSLTLCAIVVLLNFTDNGVV